MTVSIIVAASANNVIGKDGKLPWNIPEDLKHFKKITSGHPIVMGRTTYESLPIKPLPNRRNIVLTHNPEYKADGAEVFLTMSSAFAAIKDQHEEIFIIGGGNLYRQSMQMADKIYLTRVHRDYEGDTYFPDIPSNFEEIHREDQQQHDPPFSFITYEKKKGL